MFFSPGRDRGGRGGDGEAEAAGTGEGQQGQEGDQLRRPSIFFEINFFSKWEFVLISFFSPRLQLSEREWLKAIGAEEEDFEDDGDDDDDQVIFILFIYTDAHSFGKYIHFSRANLQPKKKRGGGSRRKNDDSDDDDDVMLGSSRGGGGRGGGGRKKKKGSMKKLQKKMRKLMDIIVQYEDQVRSTN